MSNSTIDESWIAPLASEVHIWRVSLDRRESSLDPLSAILSEQERERARRFRFEDLRQQFAIAHWAVRVLIGRYLSCSPELIRFKEGPYGKPDVAYPTTAVRFNLSHSSGLAAVAFTAGRDVGVDIEAIRPVREMGAIVQRFFSREEATDLMRCEPEVRDANFFRIWTRKEAFIKATGEGLTLPLDSFAVSFRADEEPRLTHLHGQPRDRAWQLHGFEPGIGFAGALAYCGTRVGVRLFPCVDADELSQVISAGQLPDAC